MPRSLILFALVCAGLFLWACSGKGAADRAREAAEEVRRSIPNVDATAVAQKADPGTVKEVQAILRGLHEYMGEINGELDAVTVHSIQAFQRSAGLPDDGILDGRTLARLRARDGDSRREQSGS